MTTLTVTIKPEVIHLGDSYLMTVSPSHSGTLMNRYQRCALERPLSCDATGESSKWGNPPWQFVDGECEITPTSAAPLGRWHNMFRITGTDPWSNVVDLDLVSPHATVEYMKDKTAQAFKILETTWPINNYEAATAAQGWWTLGQIETAGEVGNMSAYSSVEMAHERVVIFCGETPAFGGAVDLEDISEWRKGAAARHLHLATYYAQEELTDTGAGTGARQKTADHCYMCLLNLDIWSSMATGEIPLAGNTGAGETAFYDPVNHQYTLGDTVYAQRYVPDFAMGGVKGLSFIKNAGLMPETYVTTYEKPYDTGATGLDYRGCTGKCINLWDRMALVSSAVAVGVATKWVYKDASNLRTEYGNDVAYWASLMSGEAYYVTPNNQFIRNDLSGRNMCPTGTPAAQLMHPSFYGWQMVGCAVASRGAQEYRNISEDDYDFYQDMIDFNTVAGCYELATRVQNPYGYTAQGMLSLDAPTAPGVTVATGKYDGVEIEFWSGGNREYCMNFEIGLNYWVDSFPHLLGSNWQHAGGLMASTEWFDMPSVMNETLIWKKLAFWNTVFIDDEPYIDFYTSAFDAATITGTWGAGEIATCGVGGSDAHFYSGAGADSDVVVHSAGQFGHDFSVSIFPPYHYIMNLGDDSDEALRALELMRMTYDSLTAVTGHTGPGCGFPSPLIAKCAPGREFMGANTDAGCILRMGNFLFQTAWGGWNTMPVRMQPEYNPYNLDAVGVKALYQSGANKTFVAFAGGAEESFDGEYHCPCDGYITSYSHSGGTWATGVKVCDSLSAHSAHSVPAIVLDDKKFLHFFHGSDQEAIQHLVSATAVDNAAFSLSSWGATAELQSDARAPFAVKAANGDIYLFYRRLVNPYEVDEKGTLCYIKSTDNCASWGAQVTLIDPDDKEADWWYTVGVSDYLYCASPEGVYIVYHFLKHYGLAMRDHYLLFFKFSDEKAYAADGTDLGATVTTAESDTNCLVFSDDPVLCYPNGVIGLDESGNPHIFAYAPGYTSGDVESPVIWAGWTGSAWDVNTIGLWDGASAAAVPETVDMSAANDIDLYVCGYAGFTDSLTDGHIELAKYHYNGADWNRDNVIIGGPEKIVYTSQMVKDGQDDLKLVVFGRGDVNFRFPKAGGALYGWGASGFVKESNRAVATGPVGRSIHFDGSGDYARVQNLGYTGHTQFGFTGGNATIECVVKIHATAGDSQYMLGKSASYKGFSLRQLLDGGQEKFQFYIGTGAGYRTVENVAIATGTWYYLVGKVDTTPKIYLFQNATEASRAVAGTPDFGVWNMGFGERLDGMLGGYLSIRNDAVGVPYIKASDKNFIDETFVTYGAATGISDVFVSTI